MAITKINTPELFDLGTTNSSLRLPSGDIASRPSNPNTGEWRYNTDDNYVEYWDGSAWFQIDYEAAVVPCTTDTINYPTGTTNTAYYKMSDATDSTLNGYNGTATNVDFNVQGKFGNAGEFNGSSSYVDASGLLSLFGSKNTNTVSLWFKTTTTSYSTLFSDYANTSLNNSIDLNGSGNIEVFTRYSNTTSTISTTSGNYNDGNWHNVVHVVDTSGLTSTLYIDGSQIGSSVSISSNSWNGAANQKVTIGALYYTVGSFYQAFLNGSIDQVRIFSTALTADNVTSLYNEVQCVPAIIPSDYFNPLLYTGNGSTQSIDDLTFQPDLVWIKSRNSTDYNLLFDSVRGFNFLSSNTTSAEDTTNVVTLSSYDTNGFTTGNDNGSINGVGDNYVAWNWKAGGEPTATNSAGAGNVPTAGSVKIDGADSTTALAGTIAATSISANTEAGFSIVSYTTQSSGTATVGHGLSSPPDMIIVKTTGVADSWRTYHSSLGAGFQIFLNLTNAASATTNQWNNTAPTSSVFSLGTDNVGSYTTIAYCFASTPGFSDIGSYVGTGASGNTIVTGFKPAYLMVKRSNSTGNWCIVDNKRNPTNERNKFLFANESVAEGNLSAFDTIDFTSNGFILQNAGTLAGSTNININGSTYIYLAIAEQVYNANAVTANQTNPFNDGSQVAQYEFEGNATDSQPNGYIGKGGTFNGSSSIITNTNQVIPNGAASFSFWYNPSGAGGVEYIIGSGVATASKGISVAYTGSTGIFTVFVLKGTSALAANFSGTTAYSNTDWHNISVTWDGTTASNAIKLYVNGSLEAQGTSNTSSASIGAYTTWGIGGVNGGGYGEGKIDQVRIFSTALNPNDVWLLYSETSATSSTLDYPASTGAIALYELEGDATSTSSSTYDGTATNVAWVPLYDGTPTSMTYAAPSVSAPFLKAGVFNGSSSRVGIPNNIINFNNAHTISLWCNPDIWKFAGLFTQYTTYHANICLTTDGGVSIAASPTGAGLGTSAGTIAIGSWSNIVAVNAGGTLVYDFYINNVFVGSSSTFAFSGRPTSIGSNASASTTFTDFFDGKIDQVRIFNKALDEGEVLQLYNEPNN